MCRPLRNILLPWIMRKIQQSLARAINAFADSMEVLAPKMKNLAEKYPDMAKSRQSSRLR